MSVPSFIIAVSILTRPAFRDEVRAVSSDEKSTRTGTPHLRERTEAIGAAGMSSRHPNAPPTYGTTILTRLWGRPNISARAWRMANGYCVPVHTVSSLP